MPLPPRSYGIAGLIVLLASLALFRQPPPAHPGGALPATIRPPSSPHPNSVGPGLTEAGQPTLTDALHEGRFEEILHRATVHPDPATRERWLDTCARLAPPSLVAGHALRLPAGPLRERILAQAIERWAIDDPAALGEWATRNLPGAAALDLALVQVVERTDPLLRTTDDALALSRLVRDASLRSRALRAVIREWAAADLEAALRFAETEPGLSAPERADLLGLLLPPVTET